jgi:hypothetical protein
MSAPPFEHEGRRRVPEHVARPGLRDLATLDDPAHPFRDSVGAKGIAEVGEKERVPRSRDGKPWTNRVEVLADPSERPLPDGDDPLTVAFAGADPRGLAIGSMS